MLISTHSSTLSFSLSLSLLPIYKTNIQAVALEMEKESSKRQRQENDVDSFSLEKRPRLCGGDADDVMAWLSMVDDDGDAVDYELTSLLESTDGGAVGEMTRVKFIDNPYSSTLVFQSSSSYVTINGNEESCGSSFSGSESSVMASVDRGGMVAGGGGWLKEWERGAWGPNEVEASGWIVDDEEEEEEEGGGSGTTGGLLKGRVMVGWDGSDLDDYVLARFLGEYTTF